MSPQLHYFNGEGLTPDQVALRQTYLAYLIDLFHTDQNCCSGGGPTGYITKLLNMSFASLYLEYQEKYLSHNSAPLDPEPYPYP